MRTASLLVPILLVAGNALLAVRAAGEEQEGNERASATGIRFADPPSEAERARLLKDWASHLTTDAQGSQIPVMTDHCDSEAEAQSRVAESMRMALIALVRSKTRGELPDRAEFAIRSAVPPPRPESIVMLKTEIDGATRYQAAVRMVVPDDAMTAWLQAIQEQRQAAATLQAIYVASGLLAFMGILALQAKLSHAWGGKRTGILRAAAMVAILCLLGGMTAAAAAARIFSV